MALRHAGQSINTDFWHLTRSRPWWADLAQGGVETYSIDCEHEEMMNVEPVLSIGKIVSDVFARYGSVRESVLESSVVKV
ncbi:hypothetical protein [Saccharothrix sp. ALI-22-I]|uniref:hypothetical protein n=1 Tax=Saccharothrix sp. ALI-22-I TaxID=1933778 RepID=UPI00117B3238|nr:hypothetical protein [Saccharothrix sp. ALI-22-I]